MKRTWTRKPQELEGDYFFNGMGVMTRAIAKTIPQEELLEIYVDLHAFVEKMNGIDYLVVYESNQDDKIFIIDQLSKSMLEGNGYTKEQKQEYNYYTIMFAHEY